MPNLVSTLPESNRNSSQSATVTVVSSSYRGFLYLYGGNLESPVKLPVNKANMKFQVIDSSGNIPTAKFNVAVGEKTGGDGLNYLASNNIIDFLDSLDESVVVQFWLEIKGQYISDGAIREWPEGAQLAWHGYFSTVNYSQQFGNLSVQISSTHWFKDINSGTVLSNIVQKTNFSDLAAVSRINTEDGSTLPTASGISTVISKARNAAGANVDVWQNLVMPGLLSLMLPSSFFSETRGGLESTSSYLKLIRDLDSAGAGTTVAANPTLLQEFLSRQDLIGNSKSVFALTGTDVSNEEDGVALVNAFLNNSYTYPSKEYPSIAFSGSPTTDSRFYLNNPAEIKRGDLNIASVGSVIELISGFEYTLSTQLSTRLGSYSALDKVITASSSYPYRLLPTVRSGTVAPVFPIAPEELVWKTITNSEIIQLGSPPVSSSETLSSVVLFNADRGINTVSSESYNPATRAVGAFIAQDRGKVHFSLAPYWLSYKGENPNTGVEGERRVDKLSQKSQNIINKNTANAFSQIGADYARYVWSDQSYSNKFLSFVTPLRFDIAPGSHIKLEDVGIQSNTGSAKTTIIGMVTAVSIDIDLSTKTATSSFVLSYIHTPEDQKQGRVPLVHPLYDGDQWSGTELIKF